jgi:transposase-like protein
MYRCDLCGVDFEATREARHCSPRCRSAAWREQVRRDLNELRYRREAERAA